MENWHTKLYNAFDEDPQPTLDFLAWLVQSHQLPRPLHILDVGCGPGRMLPEYAAREWRVDALEPDDNFREQAQQRVAGRPGVQVLAGDFLTIPEEERYHLALAINGSFAYLLSEEERQEALQRLFRALKPGGILFLDLPNLLWFLRHQPDVCEDTQTIESGTIHRTRRYTFDLHDARFVQTNHYTLVDEQGERWEYRHHDEHAILLWPHLERLLTAAGFTALQTYNSYEARRPERLDSSRLMISAQKPAAT